MKDEMQTSRNRTARQPLGGGLLPIFDDKVHFSLGEFRGQINARFRGHVGHKPDRQFESISVRQQVSEFPHVPERTEESCEMARNARALARGPNRAAKEGRRGESHSAPFRDIFSGARWRSPDSIRNDECNFARIAMSAATHA
jgi:hypothetical protein